MDATHAIHAWPRAWRSGRLWALGPLALAVLSLSATVALTSAAAHSPADTPNDEPSDTGRDDTGSDDSAAALGDALDEATPPSFKAAFEELGAPAPFLSPFPGAVDLTTIEPPSGPQILRTLGRGVASFYGRRFHGRLTANGERFNMNAMTAAHKTLPFGTRVRVTNPRNGRSVTVRINDRGPFIRGRTIDLSRGAARELGMVSRGHARVTLDIIKP